MAWHGMAGWLQGAGMAGRCLAGAQCSAVLHRCLHGFCMLDWRAHQLGDPVPHTRDRRHAYCRIDPRGAGRSHLVHATTATLLCVRLARNLGAAERMLLQWLTDNSCRVCVQAPVCRQESVLSKYCEHGLEYGCVWP